MKVNLRYANGDQTVEFSMEIRNIAKIQKLHQLQRYQLLIHASSIVSTIIFAQISNTDKILTLNVIYMIKHAL